MRTNKTTIRFNDELSIVPSSIDDFKKTKQFKDNMSMNGGRTLRIDLVATHSGRLTRNNGFYLPQKMRDGVGTFTESYGKPILIHHDQHQDPVGRVISAKYIDTSIDFHGNQNQEALVRGLSKNELTFGASLSIIESMIEDDRFSDPGYPGLGYILVTADLTDPEAIQKVMDKRYLTVSVGATTDKAICSICKKDMVEEGFCEHKPGKVYDDKKCFLTAGSLSYDELSFINTPADSLAQIIRVYNGAMQNVASSDELKDSVKETCPQDKILYDSHGSSTNSNTIVPTFYFTDQTGSSLQDSVKNQKSLTGGISMDEVTQDETQMLLDADKHYEDMIEFGLNLGLCETGFEDKKLSTEQRKGMSKSTFCKPGERKYPVPDLAHARVAMAYAKKNNESSAVIACIRRKAAALGGAFKSSKKDNWEDEIDDILEDEANRKLTPEELALKKEEKKVKKEKKKALKEQKKFDKINRHMPQPHEDSAADAKVDPKTEDCGCAEIKNQLDTLTQELKDVYVEREDVQQIYVNQVSQLKKELADTLVRLSAIKDAKVVPNKDNSIAITDFTELSLEDLFKKSLELRQGLDISAVISKLNDGMASVPSETVADPTHNKGFEKAPKDTEVGQVIVDQKKVEANTEIQIADHKKYYRK